MELFSFLFPRLGKYKCRNPVCLPLLSSYFIAILYSSLNSEHGFCGIAFLLQICEAHVQYQARSSVVLFMLARGFSQLLEANTGALSLSSTSFPMHHSRCMACEEKVKLSLCVTKHYAIEAHGGV
jgi:hypothetical protein